MNLGLNDERANAERADAVIGKPVVVLRDNTTRDGFCPAINLAGEAVWLKHDSSQAASQIAN